MTHRRLIERYDGWNAHDFDGLIAREDYSDSVTFLRAVGLMS